MASNIVPITVAHGDGIGPEIMAASLHIIKEAGARIETETIEIGEKVYPRGIAEGIEPSAWESLRRTKVFFKAPITIPQGGGYKSLNVATRKRAYFASETKDAPISHEQIVNLLGRIQKDNLDFIKIENLYTFDGQKGFQGE